MPATKRPIEATLVRQDDGRLVLELKEGVRRVKVVRYHLSPLASDFGRCFEVAKFYCHGGTGGAYQVCVDGTQSHCDCLGFQAHGHCRHCTSLRDLIGRGEL
jgi:hypothetical protein